VKELVTRPGYVAKEYLDGRRKKYFNPISFIVATTALSALIAYQSGYYAAITSSPREGREYFPYFHETMEISVHHGKLLALILVVPLLTLLTWAFYRRPKYNFAEHFVVQSFTNGFLYITTAVIFIPLYVLFPSTLGWNNFVMQCLGVFYMIVTYRQLLQRNVIIISLKAILIKLLFIILFWVLIYTYVWLKHFILH
jgi:hypothetical protein